MRVSELPRPSPERLLRQAQAEENKSWRAQLKIFLGYTPGVGKSYRMLDEARRRHERGEDVVVAAIQPQQSEDLQALVQKLELVPMLQTTADAQRLYRPATAGSSSAISGPSSPLSENTYPTWNPT